MSTRHFTKTGEAARLAAEVEGLEALRSAGAPVPRVISLQGDQLVLERLDLGAAPDWPAMGRMLAALHRHTAPRFGWSSDNWIGLAPQANAWCDDWSDFFLTYRLSPQAQRAGIPLPDVKKILQGHRPQASLLHGDLWSGNAGFTPGGPVIFDPAVYYGDREADLAMTELFGGFPEAFYASYRKELPLDAGYETRKHLYNLYHLLNHLNLFGAGYRGQVSATLGLLRDRLQ
ncbi:MAG TPA: fructosamine kinase family protein [Burkholderiales bacterium]|nr:fructosamine kinase family protein [Burkholderiales bacterium]